MPYLDGREAHPKIARVNNWVAVLEANLEAKLDLSFMLIAKPNPRGLSPGCRKGTGSRGVLEQRT